MKLRSTPTRLRQSSQRLKNGDSWRSDKPTANARGYDYQWQKARAGFLALHPLCVMCTAAGVVTAACVVDHVRPHRGDMVIFWDVGNWQALCRKCHSMHKQRMEARDR